MLIYVDLGGLRECHYLSLVNILMAILGRAYLAVTWRHHESDLEGFLMAYIFSEMHDDSTSGAL